MLAIWTTASSVPGHEKIAKAPCIVPQRPQLEVLQLPPWHISISSLVILDAFLAEERLETGSRLEDLG